MVLVFNMFSWKRVRMLFSIWWVCLIIFEWLILFCGVVNMYVHFNYGPWCSSSFCFTRLFWAVHVFFRKIIISLALKRFFSFSGTAYVAVDRDPDVEQCHRVRCALSFIIMLQLLQEKRVIYSWCDLLGSNVTVPKILKKQSDLTVASKYLFSLFVLVFYFFWYVQCIV